MMRTSVCRCGFIAAILVANICCAQKEYKDLEFAKIGDRSLKLDIYVPEKGKGPFPLIVWIHGGGWINGDKTDCPPKNLGYGPKGYATASISYRFSDVAVFPAQLEDVKAAIRWLRAHAKEYDVDPDKIAVWGGSAGGHLACLLGVTGKTKEFDVGDNLDQSSEVQAVMNWVGPTNLETALNGLDPNAPLTKAVEGMLEKLLGGPLAEKKELARKASSTTYVHAGAPPFMHVMGNNDPLVPAEHGIQLDDKLRQVGCVSRVFIVPRGGHGGAEFLTPRYMEETQLFFDKHLKGVKR